MSTPAFDAINDKNKSATASASAPVGVAAAAADVKAAADAAKPASTPIASINYALDLSTLLTVEAVDAQLNNIESERKKLSDRIEENERTKAGILANLDRIKLNVPGLPLHYSGELSRIVDESEKRFEEAKNTLAELKKQLLDAANEQVAQITKHMKNVSSQASATALSDVITDVGKFKEGLIKSEIKALSEYLEAVKNARPKITELSKAIEDMYAVGEEVTSFEFKLEDRKSELESVRSKASAAASNGAKP